jgi:hypothetical protein
MGYLDRLAARLVEPRPLIRPRPLSRFETADALAAPAPGPGMAGEDEAWLATSVRRRAMPAAPDQGDRSPPLASSMRPLRAGASASPREQRRTSVIHEVDSAASSQDASRDVATPALLPTTPGAGAAPAMAERPAPDPTALPSFQAASSPPDAAPVPSPERLVANPRSRTAADMAVRIAPWRAPIDDTARPSNDPRPRAPAWAGAAAPEHREAAAPAADASAIVQVTIGRLELRSPEAPARRPLAKPVRAAPRMSLQDYLQRRAGGPGR